MVHTQVQIAGCSLSHVATGPQSLPCGQVNPCPTSDAHSVSGMSSEPKRNARKLRPNHYSPYFKYPSLNPIPDWSAHPCRVNGAQRQQAVSAAQSDVNRGDVSSHPQLNRRRGASRCPSHPHPVSSHRTAVIGTSLKNGPGQQLNKLGIPATTHMCRGATIPVLQNRMKYILNHRNQLERIVLAMMLNNTRPLSLVQTLRPRH